MITLKDIARLLVAKHQIGTADAETFVQQMVEVIHDGLAKDRLVKIKGFGTFKLATMKERASVNVRTGERVTIGEHDKITFTPDNVMRDIINKPFAQFETVVVDDDSPLLDGNFETEEEEIETETETEQPIAEEKSVVEEQPATIAESVVEKADAVEEPVAEEPVVEEHVAEEKQAESTVEEKAEHVVEENEDVPELSGEEQKPEYDAKVFVEANVTLKNEDTTEGRESDEEEECFECEKKHPLCRNIFIYYGILINIIVAIIFFALGYFAAENGWFGDDEPKAENTEQVVEVKKPVAVTKQKTAIPSNKAEKKDSLNAAPATEEVKKESETKDVTKTAENTPASNNERQPMKQFDSDARVRTGAYYIMGTKQEVKVKEGQTLKQIARTYLGPDMECYVEAYNGKKEVKAGETVKIPELLLKKRLKK